MSAGRYDIAVVGGGINGVGIARDASGRGLSVHLSERGDLGGGTSSASSKLIHGGLRYLERYEFRLVREALKEREVLLSLAPHIIRPMRFVLPHHAGLRPAWLLRMGLFLYDSLGHRNLLPPTRTLDLARDPAGEPLKPEFHKAFEYSDCQVEDSRLVVLNAMDAREHGAVIRTRTECISASRADDCWRLTLRRADGSIETIEARALVNATGPWIGHFLASAIGANAAHPVRLVKGSHIVVPRLYAHDRAYIFQNADGRVIFAIPYERDFTLVGTTDEDYTGDPAEVAISESEKVYLCAAANEYFANPISAESIVWSYSGVRPLHDNGAKTAQAATRDYVLTVENQRLDVYGGKITTFRRLAEQALERLAPLFPKMGAPWTATAPLPGGDFPPAQADRLRADFAARHTFLDRRLADRLFRAYGTRAARILGEARSMSDLGRDLGRGLTEAEVAYLRREEFAETTDDILWRRSKLGLQGFQSTEDTVSKN